MDFIYDFERFARDYPDKTIGVLFHTSFVQESKDTINKFFQQKKSNVDTYIPGNCVSELKLLNEHSSFSKYREKAALLLNNCSTKNAWFFRDMFSHKSAFLTSYHCDIALFVFYEPAAAADFSEKMGKLDNVYIISYDPYDKNRMFYSAYPSGTNIFRACKPLNNAPLNIPYKPQDVLVIQNMNAKTQTDISMSELSMFHAGGEASLFTAPSMPGKILKIYRFLPGDNMVTKLRFLISFDYNSALPGCVLPSELLFLNGKCVGYVMSRIQGSDLRCALPDYSESRRRQLIRDISVLLLEMRMAQLIVTDLSSGNIHVDSSGKIRIIDCDSMEFNKYPGGGVTPPYGHPDITEDYFYSKLRKSDHINFSYAVLLFEILMGWNNPLTQRGLGDTNPEWRRNRFPYTNVNGKGAAAAGVQANEEKLRIWCEQPLSVREGFTEVFNFRTTYDIGEWIHKLEIM